MKILPTSVAEEEDAAEAPLALNSASLSLKYWFPPLQAQKDKE
jgi:hypothetical protein